MKNLTVAQVEGAEVATEVLAQSIVAISDGIKRLRAGKLNDKALTILIQQAAPTQGLNGSRIPLSTIKDVLDGMASLEATYIRSKQIASRADRGGR